MLPEQQQRILGYFIEEAKEHLTTIEQGLLNLQSTLNDPETLNEVFRAAHSVKGGAAMLGLSSIQRTSHRLEDCFKILKEQPVQVDQKLETLFLNVFDTLAALVKHLQGPFGLTEEVANNLMSEAEPCFQSLHEHLDMLVKQGSEATTDTSTEDAIDYTPSRPINSPQTPSESYGRQQLQTQVLKTLRQMLQLFKQTETADNRQQLQDCCQYLAELGEELNLANWSALCLTAGIAIANTSNSYLMLAKVAITSIKQALELVLADKETEIVPSEQLEALIGDMGLSNLAIAEEVEEITPQVVIPQSNTSARNIENQIIDPPTPELGDVEPENKVHNLLELFDQDNDQKDEEELFSNDKNIAVKGPEVGSAELNTLAHLFADENPELDDSWQEQEVLNIDLPTDNFNISDTEDNDSDFDDLLLFDSANDNTESLDDKSNKEIPPDNLTLVQLLGNDSLSDVNQDLANKELESDHILNLDIHHNPQEEQDDLSIEEINALDDINELLEIKDQEVTPPWETLTKKENNNFENLFPDRNNAPIEESLSENSSNINTLFINSQNEDAEDNPLASMDENNDIPAENIEEDNLFNLLSTSELEDFSGEDNSENLAQAINGNEEGNINEVENIANSLEEGLFITANDDDLFGNPQDKNAAISDYAESNINNDLFALEETIFQELSLGENHLNSPKIDDLSTLEET
ncbi:Hpt domain-containing protein, partial [Calothrix rhizosoleniae]|uniref:Hpt domain-containing protein n=1 Tax=Calothrix rhizosoleniae TaxID=888997 RepID=UPI00190ECB6B